MTLARAGLGSIKEMHNQLQSPNVNNYCIHGQHQTPNRVTILTLGKMEGKKKQPNTKSNFPYPLPKIQLKDFKPLLMSETFRRQQLSNHLT